MKYIRILLWLWIAFGVITFSYNLYAGKYGSSNSRSAAPEEFAPEELMLTLPEYDNWPYCSGDVTRVCFDDNPLVAKQGVVEYLDENQEKKIILWWMNERNDEVFTVYGDIASFRVDAVRYSFFVRSDGYWVLAGQTSFRRGESPKNKDIPIFALDLDYWIAREYVGLMLRRSQKISDIKAPTMLFLE